MSGAERRYPAPGLGDGAAQSGGARASLDDVSPVTDLSPTAHRARVSTPAAHREGRGQTLKAAHPRLSSSKSSSPSWSNCISIDSRTVWLRMRLRHNMYILHSPMESSISSRAPQNVA